MSTPYRAREEHAPELALVPAEPRPLGRLRSTHASGGTTKRILAGVTGIAGVLAVLAFAWPHAPWLVACSLALAFAVGAWVALANLLGLDLVIDVHEGGIVVRRSWRRPLVVSFDDVTALHVARGVTDTSFVLVLGDGRRFMLPIGVSEGRRLLAALESELERPVLDDAIRALASGEPLTFGPIVLELDGLRHRDDLLPWSDLDRVVVTDGGFVFIQKATQHSFVVLGTSTLPFPRVLVALLARRTRIEPDDPFWTRFVTT